MAGRKSATFQKRQREVKRLEKQKLKTEKRAARRLEKAGPGAPEGETQPPVPEPGENGPAGPVDDPQRGPEP